MPKEPASLITFEIKSDYNSIFGSTIDNANIDCCSSLYHHYLRAGTHAGMAHCTHTHSTHTHTYIHTHARHMYTHVHTCKAHIHTHVHTCKAHTHTYVHTHVRTHAHTHMQGRCTHIHTERDAMSITIRCTYSKSVLESHKPSRYMHVYCTIRV